MRFAVRRPGQRQASPRVKGDGEVGGVPRRDVPGRVQVSVAGVSAGGAPEDGFALTRLPVHLPARRAALARVMRLDFLHPSGRLLLQAANKQTPPGPQDDPVEPGFLTDVPARVLPRAFRNRVMFLILRSSILITSKRRAMSVEAFSAQSLSRSVSRARIRAMATFTRARRFDPRRALASFRSNRRMRLRSCAVRRGAGSNSPIDRAAEIATPRSMPITSPLHGAGIGSGMAAKATCQRSARSIVTR